MSYQRPAYAPQPKRDPEPEALFNVVIEFRDDAEPAFVPDVEESGVGSMYDCLNGTGSKIKYPINDGKGIVMVPGDRIKSITATLKEPA